VARLRTWRAWLWGLVAVALIPLAGVSGFLLGERHEAAARAALPELQTAPSYTMINQLGQTVSSARFLGKVQIVSFLFPYCTTMCPLIAAHLANLENLGLRPAGLEDKVQLVSFNLDSTDTGPTQMRAFLAQYGWNPKDLHWQYLAAPEAQIRRVVTGGFGVGYQRVTDEQADDSGSGEPPVVQPEVVNKLAAAAHANYDIAHDDIVEIVDRRGRVRKIYQDADSVDWRDMMAVVKRLAAAPA
jgi:protein SCO1